MTPRPCSDYVEQGKKSRFRVYDRDDDGDGDGSSRVVEVHVREVLLPGLLHITDFTHHLQLLLPLQQQQQPRVFGWLLLQQRVLIKSRDFCLTEKSSFIM